MHTHYKRFEVYLQDFETTQTEMVHANENSPIMYSDVKFKKDCVKVKAF